MNATIPIDVQRLDLPLKPLFVRQFAAFRALVTNVPVDYSGVFIRLFSEDLSSFTDYPATLVPCSLSWKLAIPSLSFPTVGTFTYELHAVTEDGDSAALGRGVYTVKAFSQQPISQGGDKDSPGTPISVARMPTRDGGYVNCWAVADETGEYTFEFEKVKS